MSVWIAMFFNCIYIPNNPVKKPVYCETTSYSRSYKDKKSCDIGRLKFIATEKTVFQSQCIKVKVKVN